jgi:hypothetical protein
MVREELPAAFLASLSIHLLAALAVQSAGLSRLRPPSPPIEVELYAVSGEGVPRPAVRSAATPPSPPSPPARASGRDLRASRRASPPALAAARGNPRSISAPIEDRESAREAPPPRFDPPGIEATGSGERPGRAGSLPARFLPDTPGYEGRIFGQISVRGSSHPDRLYGRIHLFEESDWRRDYSERSLFGYSFRQELPDGGVREFQTGRTRTAGAYLMVTDLFRDGRISTMGHTVVIVFPRQPPGGGDLYRVVERPDGNFRLEGPNRSLLVFDGRTGELLETAGFSVSPPAAPGTPPAVSYRGLHVRIEAVGGNPFLRDRPASAIDGRGRRCVLSTSDLFVYDGRIESDLFRFADDRDFFRFLSERCPDLEFPEPAPSLRRAVERARAEPPREAPGGLLPRLLGGWR